MLLTTQEAAEQLRVSATSLYRWRREGLGPAYILVGRKVRYETQAVVDWLSSRQRQPIRRRVSRESPPCPAESLAELMRQLPELPAFQGDPLAIQQAMRNEWR
ncbi:MAG: helix-turn-helix domain-containing protein [Candidatus Competibacteraceae bacterium]|nr:helix-turn-helix domain-containing protein [Candidatus Competibacteraceae bacterium]MCP5126464.1 helix-turn-helix domain-containing protein [Gammaproteobacteria bacterium]